MRLSRCCDVTNTEQHNVNRHVGDNMRLNSRRCWCCHQQHSGQAENSTSMHGGGLLVTTPTRAKQQPGQARIQGGLLLQHRPAGLLTPTPFLPAG